MPFCRISRREYRPLRGMGKSAHDLCVSMGERITSDYVVLLVSLEERYGTVFISGSGYFHCI